MTIIMFAIIGTKIEAGLWYWICYGIWCAIRVAKALEA